MKKYGIIAAVIVLLIGVGFFSMNKPATVAPNNTAPSISPSETVNEPNTVRISNYEYLPEKITVKKGTTVTWKNEDIAKHTVTVEDGIVEGPKSEFFGKGEEYSYTFNTVGNYPYYCEPHPYMKGSVEVVE